MTIAHYGQNRKIGLSKKVPDTSKMNGAAHHHNTSTPILPRFYVKEGINRLNSIGINYLL
jgi:hypothetical protein